MTHEMQHQIILYGKNTLIVGSAVGFLYSILIDMMLRGIYNFGGIIWNCLMFSLAIILVDFLTGAKVFSHKN